MHFPFCVGPRSRRSPSDLVALPRLDSTTFRRIAMRFAVTLAILIVGATAAHAQVAESVVPLAEHTPMQILDGAATRIAHYNSQQKLRLTLSIQPPHMAEEEEFLRELTDRNSPNFHKFLTSEEWDARFAPSAEDEQAVVDWAISQGFTVTHRFDHRLLVDVEAPAGAIEKAFGVTINQYQFRDEVDFSNDRDPAIPAHLQGILFNIQGLNNIQRDHGSRPGAEVKGPDYAEGPAYAAGAVAQADARAPRPTPASVTPNDTSNSTLFTNNYANPTEIYNSQTYNYDGLQNLGHCCNPHNDSGGTPNVSNIAIAAFGTYLDSDVAGFQAAYPYLAYHYQPHYIDGTIDCSGNPSPCPDGETTQDLEWTIATANSFGSSNNTAEIFIYEGANGNNGTFTDLYGFMLSDNLARVFTTSWSCTEVYGCSKTTMDSRHNIFNKMLGEGWTLIAASGDRGSSDDCYLNKNTDTYNTAHEAVAYPGSDYDVLAAGGTYLMVYSNGSWDYEHAWQGGTSFGSCGHNNGGSGGGVSSYYGKPGFQDYSTWKSQTMRSTPDISLNAVGIGQNLYINGNLQCCANGTSIVAPELAGFFAQENAYLNYIGSVCGASGTSACTPVGQPMQYFYAAAYNNDAAHFPFYDMTGAYCNSNDVTAAQDLGYYCTGVGWDNVTGWGSANMLQLAWAIHWYLIPATGVPYVSWTSAPTTGKWYNSDQIVSWNINDYGGGTYPGTGIAGFTQGWDSIPADSTSEPHGGTNDSFYWGPQFANVSKGCLSFNGAGGCAGNGGAQGCHTAHVRGWNNQGLTTGDTTYGPVCFDTVAPTISIGTNPATSGTVWVNKTVTVTMSASDPGGNNASGVHAIYYGINTISCYPQNLGGCSVYTAPFTISTPGQTFIYYFSQDNAGNVSYASTEPYIWVSIDETAPTTTPSLSGTLYSGTTYESAVNVTLNASDTGGSGVRYTYYEIDGGSQITYGGSAFTISTLGAHTVKYWSVDSAGNTETAKTTSFTISSPTTASLVATPNPSMFGQPVTMIATVTAGFPGASTPPGSVIFYNGATNLGTAVLSAGGIATLTTSSLPGGNLTLQVSYLGNGNFLPTNSIPFDLAVEQKAALTSPTPATVLPASNVTFNWTAGGAATSYVLHLGTTVGGSDIHGTGSTTATSATFASMPANGEPIYARLYTYYASGDAYTDYAFTATAQPSALTTPANNSVLTGPSVTFNWTPMTGATSYVLHLGTTIGGSDIHGTGSTTATSATFTMPTNGEKVYARLFTYYPAKTVYKDCVFTAATQSALTSPTPSSVLTGPVVTFDWTTAANATSYVLHLGTTVGAYDIHNTGTTTAHTVTFTMPTNGETIHARLYTNYGSASVYTDYVFTAATQSALTSPPPNSVLTGSPVTFDWTTAAGATSYVLHLGTTVGGSDIHGTGNTTATTATFTMPTNGEKVYARLYTIYGSASVYTDYVYTAAP